VAGGDRRQADTALIAALAAGQPVDAAAQAAQVSERTAYRRLADPAFKRAVQTARAELLAQAVGRLADAATAAVATLRDLLDAEADSVRLGAARAILDAGMRGTELVDLAERVATLEEQQAAVLDAPGKPGRWSA